MMLMMKMMMVMTVLMMMIMMMMMVVMMLLMVMVVMMMMKGKGDIATRRSVILRFIAGSSAEEMTVFMELVMEPCKHLITGKR